MKGKAVFLDRDGTLIEHIPYLFEPEKVVLTYKCREALMELMERGYLLFILTNQSGVGRGYFSMEDVDRCNERMIQLLDLPEPGIIEIKVAPEAPGETSVYRKPSPQFILEKIREYELEGSECFMVGDSLRDIETGIAAGVQPVLVQNEFIPEEEKLSKELEGKISVYKNLYEWVNEHIHRI